ncbi:acetyl/propionyl/methylcrotonyl-CoA carboxylase subunit alpha [Amycolatopsis japonica]|uniref:acetyl-CoA carboxylase biotin carboxylase subunit n=1 Tax=Amycolatopsis TaxID=1813 RepID=UPI00068D3B2E|nr:MULTISPECIES: acetyl-CoA carboxylase biotin carboxylase subunit [unclassified Amycolatopsis]RSN39641.1 acetyl-CoA carboxylase biotin carboxylase subunit [Amycolatopsis sp. WAC 04197]
MFDKVLIANRGEIALRVARACRELGVRTVAVYSTEDRDSAVVRFADEAVSIGPSPARHSYLNMPAIIEAALRTGADAVHPGYGFLSEDHYFAEVCAANGLTFIGPPAEVIATLGDKPAARELMAGAGVPLLPGSLRPLDTLADARAVVDGIGYPVIIKAAAGGGGRGMAVVRSAGELEPAYQRTRATAQSLFGDGRVYLERYLERARHVEIQILADHRGDTVHLGERDCSTQRRHQKLIEESPAPGLPEALLRPMRQTAVRGARAAGYLGAGTFEFLVDPERAEFYFMEVNCRIQVEHPVTELVTGVDLVAEQLRIASGEPLRLRQEEIIPRGVAIECRINVEDPERDFAPAPGLLAEFEPAAGPFVRVDTHGFPGYRVPASYDSLLAKLLVWAPDRDTALRRMSRALAEFRVSGPGVRTTTAFLAGIIAEPEFRRGEHTTSIVGDHLGKRTSERSDVDELVRNQG